VTSDHEQVDADQLAGTVTGTSPPATAAVVATAAILTWLGSPVTSSRHRREVQRAVEMTESVAGRRPPALTVRGLA
jgi:hypothetical protein